MREWSSPNYYSSILVGTLKKKKKTMYPKWPNVWKLKNEKKKKKKEKKEPMLAIIILWIL